MSTIFPSSTMPFGTMPFGTMPIGTIPIGTTTLPHANIAPAPGMHVENQFLRTMVDDQTTNIMSTKLNYNTALHQRDKLLENNVGLQTEINRQSNVANIERFGMANENDHLKFEINARNMT